jgi:hypothetical protein
VGFSTAIFSPKQPILPGKTSVSRVAGISIAIHLAADAKADRSPPVPHDPGRGAGQITSPP